MSLLEEEPSETLTTELLAPVREVAAETNAAADRLFTVLGVHLTDLAKSEAIDLMTRIVAQPHRPRAIYIVNAHTLNLAAENEEYRWALNSAFRVFGDGTGVRWAARWQGRRLRDNLVGTDLVPEFFAATAGRGYRYFLLGADADSIARAAATAHARFPGWELAGFHHGYVNDSAAASRDAVEKINDSRADLLLVGMGNPLQELWIHRHLSQLRVPLSIGVGGLFDHWAGNIQRAPRWVRWLGHEWFQLMLQQPHKWRRYLLGNPKYLFRVWQEQRGRDIGELVPGGR